MLRLILAVLAVFALALPSKAATKGLTSGEAWFYIERNQVIGPYAQGEIVGLAQDGVIRSSTQVFDPAHGWAFAKDTPVLQPYVGENPAARPVRQAPRFDRGPLVEPVPQPVAPSYVPPPVSGAPIGERPSYAAPARNAGDELTRAISDYLTGRWRTVTRNIYADAAFEHRTDVTFRPDGTYEGATTPIMLSDPGVAPSSEPVSGTWRVTPLAADRFTLAMDEPTGVPYDEVTLRIEGRAAMVSGDGSVRYDRIP